MRPVWTAWKKFRAQETPQMLAPQPLGSVANFHCYLLTQGRQGCLDLLHLRCVLRIQHTADHSLVDAEATGQFGIVDLLVAHRQIKRQFRREPKWHRHETLTPPGG